MLCKCKFNVTKSLIFLSLYRIKTMIMKDEDKKYYLLQVEYALIDVSKSKKKKKPKPFLRKRKSYMVNDLENLDQVINNLEKHVVEVDTSRNRNIFQRWFHSIKEFGATCHQTYHTILRS